jgi:sulfite oxidase
MTEQTVARLESFRIGNVADEPASAPQFDTDNPFSHDPARHPALVARTRTPFNGETPAALLDTMITPNELHFVRNHLPVPRVDPEAYRLEISGLSLPISLSLADLKVSQKQKRPAVKSRPRVC